MIELVKEIKLEIKSEDGVKEFKIKRRTPTKKEQKEYENWVKKKEKANSKLDKSLKERGKLNIKYARLRDEFKDINRLIDIAEENEENSKVVELIEGKRELAIKIDAVEAEIEKKSEQGEKIEDELEKLVEDIEIKNYKLLVVEDEESKELLDYALEIGLSVGDILEEINKIIKKDTKKK